MTEFLSFEDLLTIARAVVGGEAVIGDYGMPESAAARPPTSVFGEDAYPGVHLKAAALFHSLIRNHALVDGNRRLAWTACRVFLELNGYGISGAEDEQFDFVIAVASGGITELGEIARRLEAWSHRRAD